jgi:hypothetical protein
VTADSSSLQLAPGICFSPITKDGCIVLNLERGTVLSLNDTGALMFAKFLNACLTRSEFLDVVSSDFNCKDPARLKSTVDSLLDQLVNKGVLQNRPSNAGTYALSLRNRLGRVLGRIVNITLRVPLILGAKTVTAFLLLITADAILKLAGFNALHQAVIDWPLRNKASVEPQLLSHLCSAANQACAFYPKQSLCLQRSVILTWLLRSNGIKGEMMIGVHKMPFYGHAWVELEGKVINDDKNAKNFFQVVSRC